MVNYDSNVLAIALIALYFLPAMIAVSRRAKRKAGIIILNVSLGWTVLGWIGALIWAVSDNTLPQESSDPAAPRSNRPAMSERLWAQNRPPHDPA
jgi:hypothetical protein